ncbi:response regulator transcription factor [Sediminibacterium roseum]|uniref:Response regulator transcription factor n=1 Tax=Sediminibacterium roseum TaxID=1978412 RepID=A0ABW9ZSI6_9BACT|nr:response regulator transcription factor [Sediminibacterium roseum]NCI49402.1 response regulator transcription factor [Sediminibacterium roseum]
MKILIADDHTIVRDGIKLLLVEAYPFAEITDVCDSVDLMKQVNKQKWDIIICDISMPPGESGLEAVKQIREHYSRMPIIVLSMHPADQYAVRAIRAGAMGYLTKGAATKELVMAVNTVMSGKKYLSADVAAILADAVESLNHAPAIDNLTNRELEVFKLIAQGKGVTDIARELVLSPNTVSTFRARIFEKMGFQNNFDLMRYALENKLI